MEITIITRGWLVVFQAAYNTCIWGESCRESASYLPLVFLIVSPAHSPSLAWKSQLGLRATAAPSTVGSQSKRFRQLKPSRLGCYTLHADIALVWKIYIYKNVLVLETKYFPFKRPRVLSLYIQLCMQPTLLHSGVVLQPTCNQIHTLTILKVKVAMNFKDRNF